MRPYVPLKNIAIRDSFDENVSDDIEDDVFIKDSRNIKFNEEKCVKRPLMPVRRKNGKSVREIPIMRRHRYCYWHCCEPFCYSLAALTVITAILSLIILIFTMVPFSMQKFKYWLYPNSNGTVPLALDDNQKEYNIQNNDIPNDNRDYIPCTQMSVQKVWSVVYPRLNSESTVRKVDLNGDNVFDIVFGFSVDDNILNEGIPLPQCRSPRLDEEVPCEGGVIAINGRNGELLWQSWGVANVFFLLCNLDINQDGYPDCVASGRLGMIFAINGQNGNTIWEFREIDVETNFPIIIDLYAINLVRDLDGDEIPDIMAVHLEEREDSKAGHIKIITSKTGKVIRTIPTPYREEVFVPLQIVTETDGTELLMILTGGQNTSGGIYTMRLLSLMKFTSEREFTALYRRKHSGIMVPAVLTDITGDNVNDIVVAFFNSTVVAFDGKNFTVLWNYSFPTSNCISAIVPGHFNYDNITDFMVKYNTGPGFPVYYYSQTTILNGRNGQSLLDKSMIDSGGSSSLLGGVSISQTFGGDFFLHWQLQCRNIDDQKDAYEFVPGSDIILQARADTCRLRYNASSVLKLYAISRHMEAPGAVVFSTDDLDIHLKQIENLPGHLVSSEKSSKKYTKFEKFKNNLDDKKISQKPYTEGRAILKGKVLHKIPPKNVLQDYIYNVNYPPYSENHNYKDGNREPSQTNIENVYDYKVPRLPNDYEEGYQDIEVPQALLPNDRPIHMRSKYPTKRDMRDTNLILLNKKPFTSINKKSLETLNGQNAFNVLYSDTEMNQTYINKETETAQKKFGINLCKRDDEGASIQTDYDGQWYLPSVSSTGVLVRSLNNTKSSIDFVFILNIRESEIYPPLFMPQDLNCVEEKMSAYKSYTLDNQRILRKQFLKQCLGIRYVDAEQQYPKYESQVIITRISITCTCGNIQKYAKCSELEDIQNQKWTQYMGNFDNGYFNY